MANPVGLFNPSGVAAGWFDDNSQAKGWFDADLLEDGSGPPPTAARHLAHLIPALGAVALGMFSQDATPRPSHDLSAFRAPVSAAASGAAGVGVGSVVLVEGVPEFRRTDHSSRLLQFRASAQQPVRHLASHPVSRQAEDPWAHLRPDHDLNRYRRTFQTVGQPWQLTWSRAQVDRGAYEGNFFASLATAAVTSQAVESAGQQASHAWFAIWPHGTSLVAEEGAPPRVDHSGLHALRAPASVVTSGLSYSVPDLSSIDWAEPLVVQRSHSLFPFRQYAVSGVASQPWFMLRQAGANHYAVKDEQFFASMATAEAASQAVTVPPASSYQPVAPQATRAIFEGWSEEQRPPPIHSLQPFRQYAPTAVSGQPWQALWQKYRPPHADVSEGFFASMASPAAVSQQSSVVVYSGPWQPWQLLWSKAAFRAEDFEPAFFASIGAGHSVDQASADVAQPESFLDSFSYGIPTLNGPEWTEPQRAPPVHSIFPFRQYVVPSGPGQPWHLLWNKAVFRPIDFDGAYFGSIGVAGAVSQESSAPVAPEAFTDAFSYDIPSLHEPAWQDSPLIQPKHNLLPFRQFPTPPATDPFATEFVTLNEPEWQEQVRIVTAHPLQPFRQYLPPRPGAPYALLSWRVNRQDVIAEPDSRGPMYSLYPFRVGLYVPPISYPAQGVGGFHANMGTFMRR